MCVLSAQVQLVAYSRRDLAGYFGLSASAFSVQLKPDLVCPASPRASGSAPLSARLAARVNQGDRLQRQPNRNQLASEDTTGPPQAPPERTHTHTHTVITTRRDRAFV